MLFDALVGVIFSRQSSCNISGDIVVAWNDFIGIDQMKLGAGRAVRARNPKAVRLCVFKYVETFYNAARLH